MVDTSSQAPEGQELTMNVTNIASKAEKDPVLESNARPVEDEFTKFYGLAAAEGGVIKPPYSFSTLERLETQSNALGPCIDAMVTNVDGTGHDLELLSGEVPKGKEEAEIQAVSDFFDEPWPGESMTTMRKKFRRDMERTGNGYLEGIYNGAGEFVFLRHVEASSMRLVRLDDPVVVPTKIKRRGKEVTVNVRVRQRRFVQMLGGTLVYFKEFGVTRDIDKSTGKWAGKGGRIGLQKRGTEILHFIVKKDNTTPYGVPRWVNQLPSVLGSRQAEEHNLEFFDRGGIPPVLVLVSGGFVATKSAEALEQVLNSSQNSLNAAVVEIHGQGSLDKENPVKVAIERFGGERQNDAMFESYDEKSEQRIRSSFRLPPLFVGKAEDYSFATAFASYTVAEAQVFQPERREFDEAMNIKILPALGAQGIRYRSMPLSVRDSATQLKAIEMAAKSGVIDGQGLVDSLNDVTDVGMTFAEDSDLKASETAPEPLDGAASSTPKEPSDTPVDQPAAKSDADSEAMAYLLGLAGRVAEQVTIGKSSRDKEVWADLMEETIKLTPDDSEVFKTFLSTDLMGNITLDPAGAVKLTGCTFAIMAASMYGEAEGLVH